MNKSPTLGSDFLSTVCLSYSLVIYWWQSLTVIQTETIEPLKLDIKTSKRRITELCRWLINDEASNFCISCVLLSLLINPMKKNKTVCKLLYLQHLKLVWFVKWIGSRQLGIADFSCDKENRSLGQFQTVD